MNNIHVGLLGDNTGDTPKACPSGALVCKCKIVKPHQSRAEMAQTFDWMRMFGRQIVINQKGENPLLTETNNGWDFFYSSTYEKL